MDRQAARIADIGDVVEHLERIDETTPGLAPALQLETDEPSITAVEIGIGTTPRLAAHLARVDDANDFAMLGEELGNGHRVGAMSAHAQRQGLEPLDEQERVERAHRR